MEFGAEVINFFSHQLGHSDELQKGTKVILCLHMTCIFVKNKLK